MILQFRNGSGRQSSVGGKLAEEAQAEPGFSRTAPVFAVVLRNYFAGSPESMQVVKTACRWYGPRTFGAGSDRRRRAYRRAEGSEEHRAESVPLVH